MARRLAGAGFPLAVFDVVAERVHALVELGARGADSARDAGRGCDVLVLMVANVQQAEDALYGEKGAVHALETGSAVVIMSTVGPGAVRDLAGSLSERGIRTLDAPVSGGVARAGSGDLLIMIGGPRELFDELRPVLETMGSTLAHCGPSPGDGQSVKLVNQLLCGVHIAVTGEALAYAEALGLDPRAVFETIRKGAANSFMLEDRGERMLEHEFTPPKSALDIFVKDMGLVREAAEEKAFRTPLASEAYRIFMEGADLGLGREDDSGVVRVFGQRTAG